MRTIPQPAGVLSVAAMLLLATLAACDRTEPLAPGSGERLAHTSARQNAPARLSVELCSPTAGGFTIQSTNPYFPMPVGRQWVLAGEEDGESLTLQITVLKETRVIEGVTTRVIEERDFVDGELVEVSWNYYAQAADGTICYFGEDVDIFEDDVITHEGAWCAAAPGNDPGIFMPADPHSGDKYLMEVAPGVAEDEATVVGTGAVEVPFGPFAQTIRIREFNPLDGDVGYKVFAAGMGLIIDGAVQLVEVNQTSGAAKKPIPTDQVCGV